MASPAHVLIATTEGPLAIKRIIRSPLDKSKIFGSSRREPLRTLSAHYDRFVQTRIGRIPSIDRTQAFRLDLSGDIDAGNSWQLGVFVAHALASVGALAGDDQDENGAIVVATGELDQSMMAVEVGNVEDKLRTLLVDDRIQRALRGGRTVIIAMPQANSADGKSEQEILARSGALIRPIAAVEQLLTLLGVNIVVGPPAADEAWEGSPFRGLEVFEQQHRRIFFGRGKAREEALRLLRQQALDGCGYLLVHGNSGVGKSSLVRAGVLGDIEQLGNAIDQWRSTVVVPNRANETPLSALAAALVRQLPELDLGPAALLDQILASPVDTTEAIAKALDAAIDGGSVRLALLIDQLEELLLWARQEKTEIAAREREVFADMVSRLARSGRVWVIATLRSDLLSLLDDSPILSDLSRDDRLYRLERPRRGALTEIITRPAALAGVKFVGHDKDGIALIDVLVEAAGWQQSCLPLLQFALKRLYDNSGDRTISYKQYEDIGKLERAIGDWADTTVGNLGDDPVTARAVDDVILNLGRRGHEGDLVVANEMVLDTNFVSPERALVIDMLERARLIVIDADRKGQPRTARVAHEALLTHWPRAQKLFKDAVDMLALREHVVASAQRWEDSRSDKAFLIQAGRPLIEAEHLLAEGRVALTGLARKFITASLTERRLAQESTRARVARDEQNIAGLMQSGDFLGAAAKLDQLVDYLGEQNELEWSEPQQLHQARRRRIGRIARFYTSAKQVDALAGEEDFGKAPVVCEAALESLGVFEDPQWWEHVPIEDLEPAQVAVLRQDIYRTLLLFTALMLVPGMVALFPGRQAGPPRAKRFAGAAKLAGFVPAFVFAALIRRGGFGPLRLPTHRDNATARAAFARSLAVLQQVWMVEEEVAREQGQPAQRSRASHLVESIALVLQEVASGPAGSPIDYGQWIGTSGALRLPEPVNAVDYFFIGLLNFFIAKRSKDAAVAKIVSLLQATFPDLDARAPLATAERLLRRAIELEPRYYWAHWVLGRALAENGDYGGSELAFNGAIALAPDYARGYEQRALAIANQWRTGGDVRLRDRAETDSQRAAATAKGDASIFWPRGELQELLGQTKAAVDSYALWLELEEDILGKIARGSGVTRLFDLAHRLLADSHRAALHADAHALLALVYLTWHDRDNALGSARAACAIAPNHPHALTAIGGALCEMGEYDRALSEGLDPALRVDQLNYLALLNRARAIEHITPGAALAAWQTLLDRPVAANHHLCPPWMMAQARIAIDRLKGDWHEASAAVSA